jgi:hypothetical protein
MFFLDDPAHWSKRADEMRRLALASTEEPGMQSLFPHAQEDDVGRYFRVSHNRRPAFKPVNAIFPWHDLILKCKDGSAWRPHALFTSPVDRHSRRRASAAKIPGCGAANLDRRRRHQRLCDGAFSWRSAAPSI